MPKLKKRPSPSQARILRALCYYENLRIKMGMYYKYQYCGARKADLSEAYEDAPLQKRSMKVLFEQEWIEGDMDGPIDWNKRPSQWMISEVGKEALNLLRDADFITEAPTFTHEKIASILQKRHSDINEWLFVTELRIGTGYKWRQADNVAQRIDAFAINCYPSKHWYRVAYEIKISRGDFIHELNNPEKRDAALMYSNLYYFAAPVGLIEHHELPDGLGLIEIHGDEFYKEAVEATFRPSEKPTWSLMCSLGRSLSPEYQGYRADQREIQKAWRQYQ